jgi:hypothetical protein
MKYIKRINEEFNYNGNYSEGQTGTINWGDGKKSKVIIKYIETHSFVPTDYWLEYLPEEKYRPLKHPDFGKNEYIKSEILLPYALLSKVFTPDDYLNSFDYRLNKYIEDNFPEENWNSAKKTFNKLKDSTSEQYIIDNYLNK